MLASCVIQNVSFDAAPRHGNFPLVSNWIVDPKKTQVRWAPRILWCAFGLMVVAAGIYSGPQTIEYLRLRPFLLRPSDAPPRGWDSHCTLLPNTAASTENGTVISYYGYRFEVPWRDRDREWDEGRRAKVNFKNGKTVFFVNPAFFQDNPIGGILLSDDSAHFSEAFGSGIRESNYQQFKDVISATPSQLSPFRSRKEFASVLILLEVKGIGFEHNSAASDIFSFETKGYRGFEISGLSHDWQDVRLNLFDSNDRWLRLNVSGDARSGVRLTQSEINRIIQSFGPAPAR